jgi:hypothetical protein
VQGIRFVRRIPLILIPLALAVCAATAWALTTSYSGDVGASGTLSFDVNAQNGHRSVVNVHFGHIPMKCDQGRFTTSGDTGTWKFPVKRGSFGDTLYNSKGGALTFQGKLLAGGNAQGTIKLHGALPRDNRKKFGTHCTTGRRQWAASLVP